MLDSLLQTPEKVRQAPERLRTRGTQVVNDVRHRVHLARGDGQERLWLLRTDVLTRAEDLLARSKDVPVVSRVLPRAERLVHERLEATTRPPIRDYDDLNVKKVGQAVEGLDRVELLRVRRYEVAHKNRVTVLRAVDRELERLKQPPQAA
ncbi:MAG: hypothetical protein H6739_13655 [Alphaproteobacteria bacterium]|nr:hypothetical protein [Alphaproteobacteria bacterium]